jgi:isopentenyl diphosphate isomerase/L-lactate dehydrogenase-like FMN-dependent dehydrogenase
MPILIAPTAAQGLAHADGEQATAAAAGRVGTLMVASTETSCSLEAIAAAATGPLWYQLYIYRDHLEFAERLVHRAEDAGYRAIVLTVDAPRWGRMDRLLRAGDLDTQNLDAGNFAGEVVTPPVESAVLSWEILQWLRTVTPLPIIVKGLLRADDALIAIDHGVDGIIVSNHGGRVLDGIISSIEALPAVVEATAGRCEVYLDGGIRRGIDVLKALALGARAILVGRPVLWGLAVDGSNGVEAVLRLLHEELEVAMALCGCREISDISADLIAGHASQVSRQSSRRRRGSSSPAL